MQVLVSRDTAWLTGIDIIWSRWRNEVVSPRRVVDWTSLNGLVELKEVDNWAENTKLVMHAWCGGAGQHPPVESIVVNTNDKEETHSIFWMFRRRIMRERCFHCGCRSLGNARSLAEGTGNIWSVSVYGIKDESIRGVVYLQPRPRSMRYCSEVVRSQTVRVWRLDWWEGADRDWHNVQGRLTLLRRVAIIARHRNKDIFVVRINGKYPSTLDSIVDQGSRRRHFLLNAETSSPRRGRDLQNLSRGQPCRKGWCRKRIYIIAVSSYRPHNEKRVICAAIQMR